MKTFLVHRPWLLGAIVSCLVRNAGAGTVVSDPPSTGKRTYQVAAYVWPSYHPDERAKIFWTRGIGEWETVLFNERKFDGNEPPRHPLWGYVNEADPDVMAMEIDAAADHGINVFIFDWYWYDGMPFLEGCLDNGYLKAKNNARVKFYLMWANHDVPMIWDKRNADDAMNGVNKALIWKGAVSAEEFHKIGNIAITRYFHEPSYFQLKGKPVYMIYDLRAFVRGVGGLENAKRELEWFRAATVKAGYSGLELQAVLHGENLASLPLPEKKREPSQQELVAFLGIDSVTHYQFNSFLNVDRDYAEVVKDAPSAWARISTLYRASYYPHVSAGWDNSPRTRERVGTMVRNGTPEKFEKFLIAAREFLDARPQLAPLITINSWNEWTESSYLQPDDRYGYEYLNAVKRVFKDQER